MGWGREYFLQNSRHDGGFLYRKLIFSIHLCEGTEEWLKNQNIVCANACIAYPDQEPDKYLTKDSVAFHTHLGYQMVGEFHRCAYKFGRWYNMVWMEKSLCDRPEHPEPMIWFSKLRKKAAKRQELQ